MLYPPFIKDHHVNLLFLHSFETHHHKTSVLLDDEGSDGVICTPLSVVCILESVTALASSFLVKGEIEDGTAELVAATS